MTLTPRLRFEILQRDGFACRHCGQRPPAVRLHVDHIVPRSRGGSDDPENLLTACHRCNLGKSDHLLSGLERESEIYSDAIEALSLALAGLVDLSEDIMRRFDEDDSDKEVGAWIDAIVEGTYAVWDHGAVASDHPWAHKILAHRERMRGR